MSQDGRSRDGREGEFDGVTQEEGCVCSVFIKPAKQNALVGYTVFDKHALTIKVCNFTDDVHLGTLESILLQTRPVEVIVNTLSETPLLKQVEDIVESCGASLAVKPKSSFSDTNVEADVSRLLKKSRLTAHCVPELEAPTARCSVAAALVEFQILHTDIYAGNCQLLRYPIERFLRLDKAAFTALCIFPQSGEGSRSHNCLLGFLNRCRTALGSQQLVSWVAQPLTDFTSICQRQDIVEALVQNESFRQAVHMEHLRKVPDLGSLGAKFHKIAAGASRASTKLTLEHIVKLYDCVLGGQGLQRCLSSYEGIHRETVMTFLARPLLETLCKFESFLKMVEVTIDLKEAELGNYVINRDFDPEMKRLAELKQQVRERMETHREAVQASIPFDRSRKGRTGNEEIVRLVDCNTLGFVFRVTKKDQHLVQSKTVRLQQVRVNKGEYLFTSSELKNLCGQYSAACSDYTRVQSTLVDKALQVASTYWPVVERLSELLATIDILAAFAQVAATSPSRYVRPELVPDGGEFELRGSRHALVEAQHNSEGFIANDVHIEKQRRRCIVITGPNMGGKSTYIRQIALISVMAQVGAFVPCQSAKLPILKQIMCRVGASDILLRGISTFLAEMLEASAILRSADPQSLVIVDELGRGTSTYEGFGLAWAICKHLAESIKCFCLFATHFHELGALANEVPGVANEHVSAVVCSQAEKLTFLYQVQPGCADQSYGVHVAGIAGLPTEVINQAKQKSDELEAVERRAWVRSGGPVSSQVEQQAKRLKTALASLFNSSSEDEFERRAQMSVGDLEQIVDVEC